MVEFLHRIEDVFVSIWDATATIAWAVTDRRREFRHWDADMM